MADTVSFNQIPAGVRVPFAYFEINAGQSPYQASSRVLLIGQKTGAGSAPANAPIRIDGDPTALFGAGSMLADMAVYARQGLPLGEIWALPIADPGGVAAIKTVSVGVGIAGNAGALVLYIQGEKIQINVAAADANTDVATNLTAAINAGYIKFGRKMTFPVLAAVDGAVASKINLTARNVGTLGNKIAVDKDLIGNEGTLAQYLTIASPTAGTLVPSLAAGLAALGDTEYDWIGGPYADTVSLDAIKAFLVDRWSPMHQTYGNYATALFDTFGNLAAAGAARNDPDTEIMGVAQSSSAPWVWAAATAAALRKAKDLGATVDHAVEISRPVQTLELVGVKPPKLGSDRFTRTQRDQLYHDGVSGFTVDADGTVRLDRVITTYQTNSAAQPDITWLDVDTRAQMVYFVRYMRQRIAQTYPRHALADDNPTNRPGIVTPAQIKAELIHAYKELERGGLVENSSLFAQSLVVERSEDPSRINAYLPADVVNQFRVFAANTTTFLQFPA
jgi:phage tail sheath gpL-like